MEDIESEFRDILAEVRTYLEFQKALGITHVEITSAEAPADAVAAPLKPVPVKNFVPDQPVARQPAATAKHQTAEAGPEKPKPQGLEAVRLDLATCTGCGLGKAGKTIVFGEGSPRADVLFVGGAPGSEEEKQGKPFVDDAGHLLTDIIVKGMKLRREDMYITTAVKCRMPEGRVPEPDELNACSTFLSRQIDAIKPKIIIALGGIAADALLKRGRDIAALRGTWHEFHGIPVMPTLEPAHLLMHPEDKKAVWEDIKKVLAKLQKTK